MAKEKKEKKTNKVKEQVVGFGKDVAKSQTEFVNNESRSMKFLILCGVLFLVLLTAWWFLSPSSEKQEIEDSQVNQGVSEDINEPEEEINVKEYDLHDENVIGMWGPEGYTLDDYKDRSYMAYMFTEDGLVILAMGENGENMQQYGEWSNDNNGTIYIQWLNEDGTEFYTQDMTYKYNKDEKYLILDDNYYYPTKVDVIFS